MSPASSTSATRPSSSVPVSTANATALDPPPCPVPNRIVTTASSFGQVLDPVFVADTGDQGQAEAEPSVLQVGSQTGAVVANDHDQRRAVHLRPHHDRPGHPLGIGVDDRVGYGLRDSQLNVLPLGT